VTAEAPAGEEAQADAAAVVEGALVRVTLASDVGVLLDEFPPNMRPRVVEGLRELPPEEWLARAERQIKLTRLRLNFRDSSVPGKGQLPLTQPELWTVTLDEAGPQVRTIQGHELLSWSYTFSTT